MASKWNLLRRMLYNLSKIPGLAFLYDVDRMFSKGESIRSSVKSYQAERGLEKERQEASSQGADESYEETTQAMIDPYRHMLRTATEMNAQAEETQGIQAMVEEMERIKEEYRGDAQGFMAAISENSYSEKIPQLMATLQKKSMSQ